VQTVNSNHKKLAINLTNVTNATLAIWFVPLASGENPPASLPTITPLNTWTIDNSNFPPIANGTSVTSVNNQPVDVSLSTLADDDNTPSAALNFALSNVQGGTATLLPDGRTARFTPTPGAVGGVSFDFTATDSSGATSSTATVTVGGSPITYTWNALTNGNWSAGANWVSNTPATSYRGADVRFLTGQSLAAGTTLTATNDLPGATRMNNLSFNGSLAAAGTVTVNLGGNPLQLGANGPILPTISLSGPSNGFTYNVGNHIELAADTTINGANSGRVNFNGILSGSGGFTRSGSSGTICFANNNTYQGPTVVSSGGLTVGLSGSTSAVGSLGSGDVTTSGSITFQRANTYNVTNRISGGGGVIQFGTGTLTLSPQNTYTGSTQIYAGVLSISSLNSVNGGEPPFESSCLGAPTTVATGTIGLASGATATLRYTGGGETTDRVVNLRSSASGTIEQAGTGLLKFTSNFTATGASTKTLTLTGSTAGTGELAGAVVDNSATNKTNLAKTGTGTWTLGGANSYTGTTAVSAGTLVVNGSIASPSTLTVSAGARLSGSGSIASPVTVTGTLAPGDSFGTLGVAGAISFGSASRLIWESGANNTSAVDQLNATTVSLTSGAKIDVTLNSPGSNVNFLHSFWRSVRSFPVIVGTGMSGTFSLGTISTDVGGRTAATYGSFSLQHTGTGVNLLWTPLPGLPGIDDPTLTLTQPTGDAVSLVNSALKLRVAVNTNNGAGSGIAWSTVSGPGTATFAAPTASDTFASFSNPGTYILRCTVSNPVGTAFKDFTVRVAVPAILTLREGVNDYSHQCTFIRGDGNSWNSGTRDQFIVGRGSSVFRGLLSFDVPELPPGSIVEDVTLDLWVSEPGAGATALGTLELRQLLTTFLEGTGDGSTAANGTGTGADWTTRTGDTADPWSAPGGASGTDYASDVLASASGFIPSGTTGGTKVTLANATTAMKNTVASAAGGTAPLGLYFTAGTTTGSNVYARFASNDHATLEWRPLLTIRTSNHPAPDVDPGNAPTVAAGVVAALGGGTGNSLSTAWSLVSGPGQVWFGDAASVTSTVKFSAPGSYILRLAAANANGEAALDLSITVTGTTMTALEIWRQTHFGNQANTGSGADIFDANNDGESNLLEFATGQDPHAATLAVITLAKTANDFVFTYTRSKAAFDVGFTFTIEHADNPSFSWTSAGPGDIVVDGTLQTLQAILPENPSGKCFARLKITAP
jgi:autotransporter-associated beta strand protein